MLTSESKEVVVGGNVAFSGVLLSDILTGMNHHTRTFDCGADLRNFLSARAGEVDLLAIDIGSVGESFMAILEWMKGAGLVEQIPVILITGSEDIEKVRVKTTCYGAKWIVTRDIRPERVAFLVNRLLFSHRRVRDSESVRVPASIQAEVAVIDEAVGDILNISTTGLFLKTASPLPPGTMVRLRFALPGSDLRLDLEGAVVWGKRVEKGGGIFDGVGIRFKELSVDTQKALRDYIKEESGRCTSDMNFNVGADDPTS
ncbi:MAG: PilZ domain-containing protein [Thermodesulfobacteriota bacterium]